VVNSGLNNRHIHYTLFRLGSAVADWG
jgi:hypothetical protein